jgi:capping protein beta
MSMAASSSSPSSPSSPLDGSESIEEKVGPLEAALDLLRRLPPQNVESNLSALLTLLPDYRAPLLKTVDVPARIVGEQHEFIACDYNREGESYRSPWTGEYEPARDGYKPSEALRRMEVIANEAFTTYRSLYYEGGLSSVYFWDVPTEGCFAAAILLKKAAEGETLRSGAWDAIHIIEVSIDNETVNYKLTTTILLHLDSVVPKLDRFILSGHVTRQSESSFQLQPNSDRNVEIIANMGKMVEEMESRMRSNLQEIYFGKTHDLVNEIRPIVPAGFLRHQADLAREMAGRLNARRTVVAEDS